MLARAQKSATIVPTSRLVLMAATFTSMRDSTLVRFLDGWQRGLKRLQRAHPARWRVRGMSDEEVRDALLLALFEAARAEPSLLLRRDAAFEHVRRELSSLRRRFRLAVTPVDFGELRLAERASSQEEQLAELQAERQRDRACARAESTLSRPQRQWLAAMKLAAEASGFFAASDELNLAAAARVRGLHRSSAQRAYVSLCAHFCAELARDG